MTKELLMTPKAISDRKRLEAKKNGTWQSRKLSQSKDNVRRREVYHQKKRRALTISENAPTPKPVAVTVEFPDLDKLTRKELKKLVLESRRGVPLKCRSELDPNVTKMLRTDLAKFATQKKDLEAANAQIEALKAQQSTDMETIRQKNENIREITSAFESLKSANELIVAAKNEKDAEIALLKSEIQTARRQRDDANTHSGIVTKNLEMAQELIRKNTDHGVEVDRMITGLNVGMGELNRQAIRWKSAFLSVLFIVALPSVITASVAVYLLTHR